MHQLYKNIKNLREEKDMSQTKLAELTGYTHRSSITKIEKGEVDLSLSKIEQFAKIFGKEPGELVGWEDDETEKEDYSPKIMQYYDLLNDIGQHVATEQVKMLTEVPRYLKSNNTRNNKQMNTEISKDFSTHFIDADEARKYLRTQKFLAALGENIDNISDSNAIVMANAIYSNNHKE